MSHLSVVSTVVLAIGALALVVGIVLAVRYFRGQIAAPARAWRARSREDRRRRKASVRSERRRGPRRQEDIAKRFLSGIGKSTVIQRQGPRPPR